MKLIVPNVNRADGRPDHYRFSNKWFEDHTEEVWAKHLLPLAGQIRKYLEIDTCEGRSMIWMLDNVLTKPKDHATSVDCYIPKKGVDEILVQEMEVFRENAAHNLQWAVDCCRLTRIEAISQIELRYNWGRPSGTHFDKWGRFDLIYVDGDHSARGTMEDAVNCFRLLNKNGIMVFDDMQRHWHRGMPAVHEAVRAFTDAYEGLYTWLYREPRQWAIRRRK